MILSIIIPTLNEEKVIENTLKSIKELKDCDYEIIVSDGGSKDKTIEIAKKYGVKVIVYEGSARQTIASGRNLGASIASGEFFVFLDADVTIPDINNFFRKAMNLFGSQKKLVGLTVRMKVLPELETLADRLFFALNDYNLFFSNNIFRFGSAGGEFQMIKVETFKKQKGYNEKIAVCEDIELFQRLARGGKTRIEMSLNVLHTGRRAHAIGWPKLLSQWFINGTSVTLFKRSFNTVWEEIR